MRCGTTTRDLLACGSTLSSELQDNEARNTQPRAADEGVRHRRRSARESRNARRSPAYRSLPILRAAGLNQPIRSVLDHDAVRDLAKVNGDQGRLGGLLKLWLMERARAGGSEPSRSAACLTGSAKFRRNWPTSRGGCDRQAHPKPQGRRRLLRSSALTFSTPRRGDGSGELDAAQRVHPGRRPCRRESRMVARNQLPVRRSRLGGEGDHCHPGTEHPVPVRQELPPGRQLPGW